MDDRNEIMLLPKKRQKQWLTKNNWGSIPTPYFLMVLYSETNGKGPSIRNETYLCKPRKQKQSSFFFNLNIIVTIHLQALETLIIIHHSLILDAILLSRIYQYL